MIYSVKAVVDCYKSYEIPLVVSLLPKGLLMENAFIDTRKDALGVRLSSGGGFRFLALAASVGNHFFHRRDFGGLAHHRLTFFLYASLILQSPNSVNGKTLQRARRSSTF